MRTACQDWSAPFLPTGTPSALTICPADSDSLDADSVPCVPAELASRLTTPAAVKAFVAQYQKNKRVRYGCLFFLSN